MIVNDRFYFKRSERTGWVVTGLVEDTDGVLPDVGRIATDGTHFWTIQGVEMYAIPRLTTPLNLCPGDSIGVALGSDTEPPDVGTDLRFLRPAAKTKP